MHVISKGLGTVLSQEDAKDNLHVVSYASQTLKPYEKSMKNFTALLNLNCLHSSGPCAKSSGITMSLVLSSPC